MGPLRSGAAGTSVLLFLSGDSAEGLGPGSSRCGNSASGKEVLRSGCQRDESSASAAKQSTEACDWINDYRAFCDWLQRTHPGPIPDAWPSLRRAHVYQVVEVGGRRDELGAHKRILQHLPGGRGGVGAVLACKPHPAPKNRKSHPTAIATPHSRPSTCAAAVVARQTPGRRSGACSWCGTAGAGCCQ